MTSRVGTSGALQMTGDRLSLAEWTAGLLLGRAAVLAGAFSDWSGDTAVLWEYATQRCQAWWCAAPASVSTQQVWCSAFLQGVLTTMAVEALARAQRTSQWQHDEDSSGS